MSLDPTDTGAPAPHEGAASVEALEDKADDNRHRKPGNYAHPVPADDADASAPEEEQS